LDVFTMAIRVRLSSSPPLALPPTFFFGGILYCRASYQSTIVANSLAVQGQTERPSTKVNRQNIMRGSDAAWREVENRARD
jgi:hypothetical protein